MQRHQLEHIIRAATAITGTDEFIVVGSQAILGQFPHAPPSLLISAEADLFSLQRPEDSDLIEGSIGEGSPFHQTFGYYAHGVGQETAILPEGWQERLVKLRNENTGGGMGLCLEIHDLGASKLVAGREKDLDYVSNLLKFELAKADILRDRLCASPISPERLEICLSQLKRIGAESFKAK